jgi:hypothetical protein
LAVAVLQQHQEAHLLFCLQVQRVAVTVQEPQQHPQELEVQAVEVLVEEVLVLLELLVKETLVVTI